VTSSSRRLNLLSMITLAYTRPCCSCGSEAIEFVLCTCLYAYVYVRTHGDGCVYKYVLFCSSRSAFTHRQTHTYTHAHTYTHTHTHTHIHPYHARTLKSSSRHGNRSRRILEALLLTIRVNVYLRGEKRVESVSIMSVKSVQGIYTQHCPYTHQNFIRSYIHTLIHSLALSCVTVCSPFSNNLPSSFFHSLSFPVSLTHSPLKAFLYSSERRCRKILSAIMW